MAGRNEGFTDEENYRAFEAAGGRCECCHKSLGYLNSRRGGSWGRWEGHHGSRGSPVVLCVGEPENCHLNCGHGGSWKNRGVTPRVHHGGGYVR